MGSRFINDFWVDSTFSLVLNTILWVGPSSPINITEEETWIWQLLRFYPFQCFPDSSVGEESACNSGDRRYPSSIPGSGRSAGEGIGYPLQYSWASFVTPLVKKSACNARNLGLLPGLGRSPREGVGYPLQYSGLENSMDCIVHGVTRSQTWLGNFHFQSWLESGPRFEVCRIRELEKTSFGKRMRPALHRNRSPLMRRERAAVRVLSCCIDSRKQ